MKVFEVALLGMGLALTWLRHVLLCWIRKANRREALRKPWRNLTPLWMRV